MDNFVSPGDIVELTAPAAGVTTGVPVKIGRFFGVPAVTAASGVKFSLLIEGVVDIPKVADEAWSEGLLIWYNTGSSKATSISTTAIMIGIAVSGTENATTGRVKLTPGQWLNQ